VGEVQAAMSQLLTTPQAVAELDQMRLDTDFEERR
jgi:hypothetical protein